MQYTPNFNFAIAEGTDTVNLLTQSYPNFSALDTYLEDVKATGISKATHTKVGTVHELVRIDADCEVFRFVATSNFSVNDTFTVDGVAVTTTAMDGSALPAGAFVINQSVVCILNNLVMTVVGVVGTSTAAGTTYDNSGSGLTATNVQDAIDEVKADIPTGFTASAITYNNSGSGLTATNAQDAIDEVVGKLPAGGVVTVTADGVKTNSQLLTILHGLVDYSKIGKGTVLKYTVGTDNVCFCLSAFGSNYAEFGRAYATSAWVIQHVKVAASPSYDSCFNGSISSVLAQVPGAGAKFAIEY